MVGGGFENQPVQARMVCRWHPRGGHVSSGSTVATMSAPTSARSLGGSPGADVDCGLHRRHLKTERVLGSWLMDANCGFLLRRLSRASVLDLEFDSMSGVLPRSDSSNNNDFSFGEPPWRSTNLHISD